MNNNSIDESNDINDYINANHKIYNLNIFIKDNKLNFNCSHYSKKIFISNLIHLMNYKQSMNYFLFIII